MYFLSSTWLLHDTFTTQPLIEPRCGGLVADHANHYTTQLATMQWQNVVFWPNVWEKGNGSRVSVCMTSYYWKRVLEKKRTGGCGAPQNKVFLYFLSNFWYFVFMRWSAGAVQCLQSFCGAVQCAPGLREKKLSESLTDKSKKVFTQIWSYFLTKIRWRAKKKKKVFTQVWPYFLPKSQGRMKGKEENKLGPKLDATTSTLPGPPRPGPGYYVPPEPVA